MTICRIALVLGLVPGFAYAEQEGADWRAAPTQPTVSVLDKAGVEIKGKLLRLDNTVAVVLVDGIERRLSLERLQRIEVRGDSLKNGAIIGATIGFAFGAMIGALGTCEPPPGVIVECKDTGRWATAVGGALIYGALGAGVDALFRGRKVLYQSPTLTGTLQLSPTSIGLKLRW